MATGSQASCSQVAPLVGTTTEVVSLQLAMTVGYLRVSVRSLGWLAWGYLARAVRSETERLLSMRLDVDLNGEWHNEPAV